MIKLLEGKTDIAAGLPRMGWDVAAFDALSRQAGAVYVDPKTKQPLRYGQTGLVKLPVYIAGNLQTLQALNLIA